jgi:hypothetical protein
MNKEKTCSPSLHNNVSTNGGTAGEWQVAADLRANSLTQAMRGGESNLDRRDEKQ